MNLLSLSLKSVLVVSMLSANLYAQAPSTLGKSKAKTSTEAQKNTEQKTQAAQNGDKKPGDQANAFMPTAEDLTDEPAVKDPNDEIQELKDKRWIQQGAIDKPSAIKNSDKSKLSVSSTCTDKSGKTLNPEDAGYQLCVQEVSNSAQRKDASSGVKVESTHEENGAVPKANVGLKFKIGD